MRVSCQVDDTQPDHGVGLAGLGKPLLIDLGRRGAGPDHGVRRDRRLVELDKSEPVAIGGPPEALFELDLLAVNPVDLAVEPHLAPVAGEPSQGTVAQVQAVEVVL